MRCVFRLVILFSLIFTTGLVTAQTFVEPLAAEPRRLEGTVLDRSRAPIPNARVSLSVGPSSVAQVTTGVDGKFTFANVALSEAVIVVAAPGFAEHKQTWSTTANENQPLEIILEPDPITAEVTVTATRTEARLSDTAASVSILSRAQLTSTAAIRVDDALRQIPGFSLFRRSGSRTANPTTQGVSLRGVGASGASRGLVLFDAIPLNDPFGGWVYWGRVPRETLTRVEVLRGGASHLYGSAALGGVVNLIAELPSASHVSLEVSYGNEQTPDGSISAGTSWREWSTNISGEIFKTDGYIIVDEPERGLVDTNAGSRSSTIDLNIARRLANAGHIFLRGALYGESRTNGTQLQTNRTHIRQLSSGADFNSNRLGSFAFRAYGGTQVYDQDFTAVAANRNSETLTRVQRVPAQSIGASFQWSRSLGLQHTLVAGVEGRGVRGTSDEIAYVQGRPSSLIGAGGRERTIGFFAEDIYRLSSQLFLTGGVRVDRWREFAAYSTTRPLRPPGPANTQSFSDRKETAVSPQLSVLYKPTEIISLSASFMRAFRQPTLNELYRSFRVGDVLTLANENLRAERLTGGETSASVQWLDQKLITRGTFFWTEMTLPVANVTLSTTPALITRQRRNLGRTRSRGFEFEAEAQLFKRLFVTGSYLFANATVLQFPANTTLEGLSIPQVPRHQFTFQTRYSAQSYTVGVQGRGAGNQFDDDLNQFPLGRYFTLDLFASKHLGHQFELFAAGENILNADYAIGRTPVTTVGAPRLVRVGFRVRFGNQ